MSAPLNHEEREQAQADLRDVLLKWAIRGACWTDLHSLLSFWSGDDGIDEELNAIVATAEFFNTQRKARGS